MDHIGFDLGKVNSQLCIITSEGELIERRISTSRDSLTKLLGSRPPAHILIEAATESKWVARHLEGLGHEVVVADPNFAPMCATRSRRVKTDKRDARTLAEACRLGAYRPAHRTSDQQRHIRAKLAVREALVRTRELTAAEAGRRRILLNSQKKFASASLESAIFAPPTARKASLTYPLPLYSEHFKHFVPSKLPTRRPLCHVCHT